MSFKPSQKGLQEDSISRLENCVTKTRTWMNVNILKLNDEKTKFVTVGTNQQLSKLKDILVRVGNEKITLLETVCDLGYYLDKNLKNGPHINKVTGNCFHTLRNIQKLRSHTGPGHNPHHCTSPCDIKIGLSTIAYSWEVHSISWINCSIYRIWPAM